MNKRKSWDQYFIDTAILAAGRSTCLRRQVGAVLVKNKMAIATGYNGAPRRIEHCITCQRQEMNIPSGERHELCRAIHAEQNAIIQCARTGVSTEGSTLYTTTYPCSICTKMIINAGIKEIICMTDYPDETAKELFYEAGIMVRMIKG